VTFLFEEIVVKIDVPEDAELVVREVAGIIVAEARRTSAQINDLHACLSLFQDAKNLFFGESFRFHVYLLFGVEVTLLQT